MGNFTLQGPDGRRVTMSAPDNATEEQIKAKIESVRSSWKADDKGQLAWSDVPGQALSNAPSSALKLAKNIVYPIMHPIETVKGLYNIGYGGASKLHGALGGEQDPEQKSEDEAHINAVGTFFKDRYGGAENVKNTMANDPVGVAADAAAVLTGGGSIAARVPGVAAKATSGAMRTAASAIDPITNAIRASQAVSSGVGKGTAAVLGTASGTGALPVETAYRAGKSGSQVFTDHMRGRAPAEDALDMAQGAMREVRSDRSNAYTEGMGAVRGNTVAIDFAPVTQTVRDAYDMITFKGIPKSDAAAKTFNEIRHTINVFQGLPPGVYRTAEGLDALKQAVGEIRLAAKPGTLERRVSEKVYNSIKAQIVKQVPEYAKTMKDYSQASDQIDDLTKTFSLGEKASKDTAIRKLTSVMRNNVNTNYGQRARLMDELARKEPELPNAIAGQAMSSLTPRGMAALPAMGTGFAAMSNPMALAALPFTSPRFVGEAAYGAGQAGNILNSLSRFAPGPGYRNALYAAGLLGQNSGPSN